MGGGPWAGGGGGGHHPHPTHPALPVPARCSHFQGGSLWQQENSWPHGGGGWGGRRKRQGAGRLPEPFSTTGPILNPPAGQPCPALPWSAGRAFGMKLLISSSSHPLSEALTQRESTLWGEVLLGHTAAAATPTASPRWGCYLGRVGGGLLTPAWTGLACISHEAQALGRPKLQVCPCPHLKGSRGRAGGLELGGGVGGAGVGV